MSEGVPASCDESDECTALLSILAADILPIFAIAAIGFLLERRVSGSAKTLSAITFNVLSPCLVFYQLVTSRLSGAEVGRIALFCFLLTAVMGIAARLVAIPLGLDRRTLSSFLLVVMFSNTGNYALPLILFAFGQEALSYASVYFATSAIIVYTVGVFIAASSRSSFGRSFLGNSTGPRCLCTCRCRHHPILPCHSAADADAPCRNAQ